MCLRDHLQTLCFDCLSCAGEGLNSGHVLFVLLPCFSRSALQRLQQENRALKGTRGQAGVVGLRTNHSSLNQEKEIEEEGDNEEEGEEEETSLSLVGKRGHPCAGLNDQRGKRLCKGPPSPRSHHHTHQPETVTRSLFNRN